MPPALAGSERWFASTKAGINAFGRDDYAQAEEQFKLALHEAERFGADSSEVVVSLENLAGAYLAMGKYDLANHAANRSLLIAEKKYGNESLSVARILNILAVICRSKENYEEGRNFANRSLEIAEKEDGPVSLIASMALSTLAAIESDERNYAAAARNCEDALAINRALLSQDDCRIGKVLVQLATIYCDIGRADDAVLLLDEAKRSMLDAPTSSRFHKAQFLAAASLVQMTKGDYMQAETLLKQALKIEEEFLDPTNPRLAIMLNNLALVKELNGNIQAAEPLYQRSLALIERAVGKKSAGVATISNNIGANKFQQSRLVEAEALFEKSLSSRIGASAVRRSSAALNNLALLYCTQSKFKESELLFRRAIVIDKAVYGDSNGPLASSLAGLSILFAVQGKYSEAEPLCKQSLAMMVACKGEHHPDVAVSLDNYAYLLRKTDREKLAATLEEQARKIRVKVMN
jgi:tetratricopeptide (TPR) repeat protein